MPYGGARRGRMVSRARCVGGGLCEVRRFGLAKGLARLRCTAAGQIAAPSVAHSVKAKIQEVAETDDARAHSSTLDSIL
jgi:hypothetical protein